MWKYAEIAYLVTSHACPLWLLLVSSLIPSLIPRPFPASFPGLKHVTKAEEEPGNKISRLESVV